MESLSLEEENIIKGIRNFFRLKKEQNYTSIKGIRNLFIQEKESEKIKDRILRNIKDLFEHEKCGGSYIDSPDWIKNKKATVNPINKKDNKRF